MELCSWPENYGVPARFRRPARRRKGGAVVSILAVSYLNNSHAPIRNDITINATVRSPVRSQIMRISCVWTDASTTLRGFESQAHE
jgi:hypothetical protein